MAKRPTLGRSAYTLMQISDLSGGMDLRHSPTLMQPNRSRNLRNFSLREPGALCVAAGYSTFSQSSLGNARPQGGQRVYLAGSTLSLVAYNGSVYKPSDDGTWGAAVLAGLNASNQVYFPHDRDLVAVFDGANVPKKSTDGATWTQLGITAPAVAPTASAVAGGSLTDGHTYEFSYAYRDDALAYLSNEGPTVEQAITTPNLTARVQITGSGDPQVHTVYLYARDVTAGETVRRKCGSVANPGGGATATVDITGNTWSAAIEAPTDHNVPPALSFGVYWKYRWWAFDATVKNRLRFSQVYTNQAWPSDYYLDIPFDRGDAGSALVAQGDTLIVFGKASKPYLIIGQTSLDFEVRPAFGAISGAFGPRAVDLIEYGVVHAAASGVYLFDGSSDRLLSYDIDPGWQDLVQRATAAQLATIAVVYHEPTKELHIAVPRRYPSATWGEWVLDLNRTRLQENSAWTATDRAIGGYLSWNGAEAVDGNRGRLLSWSPSSGELFEEVTGTSANGSDLTAEYEGPTLTTGLQVGRVIEIWGEYRPAPGRFSIEVIVDGLSTGAQNVTINDGLAEYGSAVYGVSDYGGVNRRPFHLMLPLTAEGRTVTCKARYDGQGAFQLYGYTYAVVPEALPRAM